MRSAGRTRFQLTPDSASGDRVERERCTAGRCRCRCIAGVCRRRRSATQWWRCVCPRRCRGLTESVTACAVGVRLWSSGVPPARRQQGRVESRHAALRSAYRVTAECRRSATMSGDVGGDALQRERGGVVRSAVGMTDALQRERRSGPQGGPVFS